MKGILMWTTVVLVIWFGISWAVTQDVVYSGTDLEFKASTSRNLNIKADSGAVFEGASESFFLLRKLSGETIAATPKEPPLGWSYDTYYTAGPTTISNGAWIVEDGSPTIRLISDQAISVTAYDPTKPETYAISLMPALLIWIFGILIYSVAKSD